jgi:hypothetical protein
MRNTIEELKSNFRLIDGRLERLNRHYKDRRWTVVSNNKNHIDGYCHVKFRGGVTQYHTIVWVLSTGKDFPDGYEIDHINGDKIDNRIENMRLVTTRKNMQNMRIHREGKLCGNSKCRKKYRSHIRIDGTLVHLGMHDTEQEAYQAYTIACKHTDDYIDTISFREMVKKELERSKQCEM